METATALSTIGAHELVVRRADAGEVLPLLRQVWGDERDLVGEYPLVLGDGAGGRGVFGRFAAAVARERVVACIAYLERDFVTPFGDLRLALLGSVTTDPRWRGRGLASALLGEVESWAARSGCVATLLWPTDGRVYESAGYRPAACEWNVVLPTDLALGDRSPLRAAQAGDVPALLALYDRHQVRVRRSAEEFGRLLACPRMRTLVALRGSEPIAYACLGRGGDLGNCVHEWAGEPGAVLALVRAFANENADTPRYLLAPDWSSPVTEALLDVGCPALTRAMGMAKLADRRAAARYVGARTGRTVAVCGGSVFADGVDGPVALSDADLLAAVVPEENQGDALESIAARLGTEPADLPAYAFAWGLDSI